MIKKETIKQFFKFAIIGVINTLINLLILYVLKEFLGINYLISEIFAFIIAATNSFILNKTWTFEEKIKFRTYSKYIKFIVVSAIALCFNLIFLYILVDHFKIWYIFAQIFATGLNLIINFSGNKLWTFKR